MILSKRDGIYSVDSFHGNRHPPNQVLMDLGKYLEKMLTLNPKDFEEQYLDPLAHEKIIPKDEAFNYLKLGSSVLVRSQIDCKSPKLNGDSQTFELKTRAALHVRRSIAQYEHTAGNFY